MRAVKAVLFAIALAACGSSNDAPTAPLPEPPADAGPVVSGPNVDTSDPPAPPPPDAEPCPKSPCLARPVIFIHGHTGGVQDGKNILTSMTAAKERLDDWRPVGTEDHQAWGAKSIPRRSWGFNFDYYLKHGTEAQGTYTAGQGRIGSDPSFACAAPAGKGHIRPSEAGYDQGVDHEFAVDLAALVESILRATGEKQLDIVTHSMGGLITRSYISFLGGADKVHTALYLSTPHLGVSFASGEATFNKYDKDWMTIHELAELDCNTFLAKTKFMVCGQSATDTWPNLLMSQEALLPKLPEYHCMRGEKDPIVDDASAHHPKCVDYVTVPDTDHGTLPYTKEAADFAKRVIGGFVTASTKL